MKTREPLKSQNPKMETRGPSTQVLFHGRVPFRAIPGSHTAWLWDFSHGKNSSYFLPSLYLDGPLEHTWHYKDSEKRRRRKRKRILLLHSLKEVYPLGSLGRAGKLSHMAKGYLDLIGSSCLLTTPCGQNSEMFPEAWVSEHHPDVFLVHPFTR